MKRLIRSAATLLAVVAAAAVSAATVATIAAIANDIGSQQWQW